MKNTATDYFTQLRSDFVPKEKSHCSQSRRPFNHSQPNEMLYVPGTPPNTNEGQTASFSASNAPAPKTLLS